MNKPAVYFLVFLIFAGTFALAPTHVGPWRIPALVVIDIGILPWPTRTLTDIKGPVFATGALAMAIIALWSLLSGRATWRPAAGFALAAAAYLGYAALSSAWASHPWIVKYAVADRFLMLILALAVAVTISTTRAWKTIAGAYVVLGGCTAAFALYWHGILPAWAAISQKATGEQTKEWVLRNLNDVRAPLGNANLLAAVLMVALMIGAGFAVREWRGRRRTGVFTGLVFMAVFILPALYFCRAYSYYIALCVAISVFVALQSKRPVRVLAGAALVGCILVVVAWRSGAISRFMETKSYLVRVPLWQRAMRMAKERPVLGWGAGNYFTDSQPFAGPGMLEKVHYYEGGAEKYEELYKVPASNDVNVHNEYLQELSEGGIAGLVVYAGLLAAAIGAALYARKHGFAEGPILNGATAAFAAVLTANFFNCEIHFHDFQAHFWILAGLLAASRTTVTPEALKRPVSGAALFALAVATAAAGYGVWTFAIQDYRSSIAYQRPFTPKAEGAGVPADSRSITSDLLTSAKLTWDQTLRSRCLYSAAHYSRKIGQSDTAYGIFEILSGEIAAYIDADYMMGQMLEDAGQYEKALFYYKRHKAGRAQEQGIDARIRLTETLLDLQQGRLEEGIIKGRDYLLDYPDDRAGRRAFVREVITPEMKRNIETSIQADGLASKGATAEDLALAGIVKYLRGGAKDAVAPLERAMAGGYKGRDGFYYLASCYVDLGRPDDARKVVGEARRIHPQCRGLEHLAFALGMTGSGATATGEARKP